MNIDNLPKYYFNPCMDASNYIDAPSWLESVSPEYKAYCDNTRLVDELLADRPVYKKFEFIRVKRNGSEEKITQYYMQ
jgi:hypothetical protein